MGFTDRLEKLMRSKMPSLTRETKSYISKYVRKIKDDEKTIYRVFDPNRSKKEADGSVTMEYDDLNPYVYAIWQWKTNINFLKARLATPKAKIRKYLDEIKAIDAYVIKRRSEYRRRENVVIDQRARLKAMIKSFRARASDLTAKERREEMKRIRNTALGVTNLDSEKDIHRGDLADIDDAKTGAVHWDDIRNLKHSYKHRISVITKNDIEPIEDEIERNNEYLEIAIEEEKDSRK